MLDGEAEAEISELFAMKDQEWALCTGGFTGVKWVTAPGPAVLVARRDTAPKDKKLQVEKKSFWF